MITWSVGGRRQQKDKKMRLTNAFKPCRSTLAYDILNVEFP